MDYKFLEEIMLRWPTSEKENSASDMVDLDKYFGFECCWTCSDCLLDIGIKAYICRRHGHTIGGNEEACLPTNCKNWNH